MSAWSAIQLTVVIYLVWTVSAQTDDTKVKKFLDDFDVKYSTVKSRSAEVEYALKTNITTENEETYSKVMLEEDAFRREWATNASRFTKVNSSDYIRQLYFIKDIGEQWQTDTSKSKEMNDLLNKMSSIYAKGKICLNNKPCMAMEPDIHDLMASSTDYDELLEAWIAWRDATGRKMKPLYKRFVELYNEAIRLSGHKDAGEYWRSWYETPTFEEDLQNLLNQVRPLYELLHAYVRMRLKDIYPKDKFPASGHIPAHLLGCFFFFLFKKNVLSAIEYQQINSLASDHKKIERLLFLLKAKPPHTNAYQELISALEKDSPWLAEQITNTETKSDASVSATVNPNILNDEASRVLHENYHNQKKKTVPLADIRNCLKKKGVFKDYCEWNNNTLIHFVQREFAAVKYVKRDGRFTNLCKNDHTDQVLKASDSNKVLGPDVNYGLASDNMVSSSTFCCSSSLREDLIKNKHCNTPPHIRQSNSKPGVSRHYSLPYSKSGKTGKVHRQLSLPNNSSVKSRHNTFLHPRYLNKSPLLNGTLKKSNSFVRSLPTYPESNGDLSTQFKVNSDLQVPLSELLSFESQVKRSDTYIQGQCIKVGHCNNRCKLTPIKNIHHVPDNAEDFIAKEVVKFAAACLNDRQNGTVYFGLDTVKNKSVTLAKIVGVHISTDILKQTMSEYMEHSFAKKCWDIIQASVQEPRFVPVVNNVGQRTSRYVIEVDIIPNYFSVGDSIFWTKPYLENKRPRNNHKSLYTFSKFGFPEAVKLNVYKKSFEFHIESRQTEEKELRTKLTNSTLRTRVLYLVAVFILIVIFIGVIATGPFTREDLYSKPLVTIFKTAFSLHLKT
ncbi:hypothetical protein Btru_007074 [Bulinus truncatus]|nr:hypothetical protein Btru_007074 [Bulinus truncatus]